MTCCVFVLVGCTDPERRAVGGQPQPATGAGRDRRRDVGPPSDQPSDGSSEESSAPTEEPPNPVSLPALQQKEYDGARLRLGAEVYSSVTQRQYEVTYRGGGLTISGRIAIPEGRGRSPRSCSRTATSTRRTT